MARGRIGSLELARLLDAVGQALYVLDAERTIVFCNQACADWLGRPAEEVQGGKCVWSSSSEGGADSVAAGLCPPPAALAGQETSGVVGCGHPDGQLSRRRARFIPLAGEQDSDFVVLALVEPAELSEAEALAAPASAPEAAQLHERLRSFRHEMAQRYRMDRFVGSSPAIRRVRAQLEVAAASRASVLIVGPPGSGRQHAAHTIHYAGAGESSGPLVPLACAVLGAELMASTLGAIASRSLAPRPGGQGTLVLGDVDQLEPGAQAEVARLLGARGFPLRVIATARQDLIELAGQGKYREDLASGLSTLTIHVPALAERRGDVALLAQMFVEEVNARSGRQIAGFSPEAMDYLDAYAWPGNVDELARVVSEAHARCEGTEITVRELPQAIQLARSAAAHPRRPEETIVLDDYLARIERELMERALARAKGNKSRAAKLLGMTRPRLYRRLVQLGLEEPQ